MGREEILKSADQGEEPGAKRSNGIRFGSGIGAGVPIGVALGVAMGNLGAGIAIGVATGVGIGVVLSRARRSEIGGTDAVRAGDTHSPSAPVSPARFTGACGLSQDWSEAETPMTERAYFLVCGTVFFVVAVGHLTRLIIGWDVTIAGWVVPQWLSVPGLLFPGLLSAWGLVLGARRKTTS